MSYLKKILLAGLVTASFSIFADLPQPYASIRNMPSIPYYVQDGYVFFQLINSHNSSVIVDVESQDGSVARYIAQQKNNLSSINTIYSVNSWTDYGAQRHLFQRFLSNVIQENTADSITPIRMSSQEAALALNVTADFISLVGGNDADIIYRDILAWYPHLADGGVLCGNNWNENAIEIGVTKAAAALDLTLKINDNVWYFEKNPQ